MNDYEKCSRCLKRVPVVSENGIHYNCSLSNKKWNECVHGIKDHSLILKTEYKAAWGKGAEQEEA